MSRNKNALPLVFAAAILTGGSMTSCKTAPHHEVTAPGTSRELSSTSAAPAPSAEPTFALPPVPELSGAKCHMRGVLPDPNCTPGATNPEVTQDNIMRTICVSGFTATIRPSSSYTNRLKAQQMTEYGFTDSIHDHEEDHLISLELGGSPADPHNLWPEPDSSPNPKDRVENFLHTAICAGRISLHAAQVRIATDWTTAENGL